MIIWIAAPFKRSDTKLLLSVVASPQLAPGTNGLGLATYLTPLSFDAQFFDESGAYIRTFSTTRVTAEAIDSNLQNLLFSVPVDSFDGSPFVGGPVNVDTPDLAIAKGSAEDVYARAVLDFFRGNTSTPFDPTPFKKVTGTTTLTPDAEPFDDKVPDNTLKGLGLHSMFSALRDHRTLQRRVGLVIDLEIDLAGHHLPDNGFVCVVPSDLGTGEFVARPCSTAYTLTNRLFLSASSSQKISNGYVKFEENGFDISHFDVEAAAYGLLSTGSEQLPPPLKSSGLTFIQSDFAAQIQESLSRAATHKMNIETSFQNNNTLQQPTLFAEDLVLGYIPDFCSVPSLNDWLSTCKRRVLYEFESAVGPFEWEDEGCVTSAVVAHKYIENGVQQTS